MADREKDREEARAAVAEEGARTETARREDARGAEVKPDLDDTDDSDVYLKTKPIDDKYDSDTWADLEDSQADARVDFDLEQTGDVDLGRDRRGYSEPS